MASEQRLPQYSRSTNRHTRREAGSQSHGTHVVSRVAERRVPSMHPHAPSPRVGERTFWTGDHWATGPEPAPSTPSSGGHRRRDLASTLVMALVLLAMIVPFAGTSAAGAATLTISPGSGKAGQRIAVAGAGFPAKTTVYLLWDGSRNGMPSVRTTVTGTFATSFNAPAAKAG